MKQVLAQIWGILTGEQKRGVFLLMIGGLFLALLDTITVALNPNGSVTGVMDARGEYMSGLLLGTN